MEWSEQKITSQHLVDVIERKETKLRWKHIKLSARTKMSVKRAVEVCSEEVVTDICQGSFPLEETIGTRMYLSMCAKLFRLMNNSTEIDPSSYGELIKILLWFNKWHNEIKITMPEKGQRKAHWKKFITERTYKDLARSIRAFLGLVQYIQMNHPDAIIIPKTMCQDDVENYFSLQRARIASSQPTVLQFYESAATLNTDLLLTSEFGDLHESIGSYDPVCIPNAMKIPLLRRNTYKCSSESDYQFHSEPSDSNNSFLPLTVTESTFDKAQKQQLLRHSKQTLEYIDLSTSSTIIQANQIIVHAMKSEVNSTHFLHFISCIDHGLRMHYFNKESWSENSLTKALVALKKDSILMALWNNMLTKMHVTRKDNELACDLLFLFVKKFTKRRCVTYLAVDGFGPSAHQDNSAIRQLLKKYDIHKEKTMETVIDLTDKSKSKCHGCGEPGHWVRDCPKGYNKVWLTTQQCFKCGQLGHFRRDCPDKAKITISFYL